MITVVTGKKNAGKSSFLLEWFNSDPRGAGILTMKRYSGIRLEGYDIMLLPCGKRINLCEVLPEDYQPDDSELIQGKYLFDKNAFAEAEKYLLENLPDAEEPFWLDEVSYLELNGKGFYPLLHFALSMQPEIRLGVRESCLNELVSWFDKKEVSIIHLDE